MVARLIADWLSRRLNGQFVVENRPGAANNIGTEDMIRSPADGYTLLLTNPTNAINATYYAHLTYNFLHDSDPVAGIMRVPNVLVVERGHSGSQRSRIHRLRQSQCGEALLCVAG